MHCLFKKLLLCKEKARQKRLMFLITGRQQITVILNLHSINAPAGRWYKVDRSHISILRFDGMCCQQLRWNILIQKSSFLQAFPTNGLPYIKRVGETSKIRILVNTFSLTPLVYCPCPSKQLFASFLSLLSLSFSFLL